jgi:flagellin
MGLRINQNIAAMNAYRNLSVTDGQMSKSLEKLSSGFRINRAADDAAGLSISENLRSAVGGLKTAIRNAQDGISVVQTAEGSLTEVHSILQRMRDLSVQAANSGSQDVVAREAAQTELTNLNSELDRIGKTTSFGASKLLDGTFGLQGAKLSNTQQDISAAAFTTGVTETTVTFTFGKTDGSAGVATTTSGAVDFSQNTFKSGTTYTNDAAGAAKLQANLQADIDAQANTKGKVKATVQYDSLTQKTSISFSKTSADGTDADKMTIASASDAASSALTKLGFTASGATDDVDLTNDATANATLTSYGNATSKGNGGTFQVGANNTTHDRISVSIGAVDSSALGTSAIDLVSNAAAAINVVDSAIKNVSTTRATLGAYQNRFEHTINNLSVAIENLSASESRIRDTDMASEMVSFTRAQILSQAGTAMLAQANQAPQGVLQLLR